MDAVDDPDEMQMQGIMRDRWMAHSIQDLQIALKLAKVRLTIMFALGSFLQ